jgi:hypothetical protein
MSDQTRVHLDSFSGALGDLPKNQHGDRERVLAVLRKHPRFSCFDATATNKLAKTLDDLKAAGRIVYAKDEQYPWCRVTVVDPL